MVDDKRVAKQLRLHSVRDLNASDDHSLVLAWFSECWSSRFE